MENTGKQNIDKIRASLLSCTQVKKEDQFNFWNGDNYDGEFLATKHPVSIVREGKGTYKTNDHFIFSGIWSNDLLLEANEITFPDESKFTGSLNDMIMEGPGSYRFKEGVEIKGYLYNNEFINDLKLIDPNGHSWQATNPNNENEITFYAHNLFWQSVLDLDKFFWIYGEEEEKVLASEEC